MLNALFFLALLCLLPFPAFAAADVREELKNYLMANYPWAEVDLSNVKLSGPVPDQSVRVSVIKPPPGKTVFRLSFDNGGSATATAMVRAFDRVTVSRGGFNKGYVLKKDDVYATLMESGRIPKGALREEKSVVDKTLTRSIVANAVMVDSMVSETTVVKRGRRVVLCAQHSAFTIRAAGELKQDAAVGDYVKVLNLLSNKIIVGRLIDDKTVLVEF